MGIPKVVKYYSLGPKESVRPWVLLDIYSIHTLRSNVDKRKDNFR